MSDDDSSFEQVRLSDLESVATTTRGDTQKAKGKVVVEFPPHFVTCGGLPEKSKGAKLESLRSNGQDSRSIDQRSTASSNVPVTAMGQMKIQSPPTSESCTYGEPNAAEAEEAHRKRSPNGDESQAEHHCQYNRQESLSSWNTDSYSATDAASVAASSTISGFDLISLSGKSKRRCQRCSFLNRDEDGICDGCGLALVANPCIDLDAQIAKNLQLKEEEQSFRELKNEEKKRKVLSQQPVLVRARVLTNDIMSFVEGCKVLNKDTLAGTGFSTLPKANLVVLASSFIDFMETIPGRLSLCYHFSKKLVWRMTQIRQDSFGPNEIFSTNVEAAMQSGSRWPKYRFKSSSMYPIPENEAVSNNESGYLGWIAVIGGDTTDRNVNATSGTAILKKVARSYQALPLVCFDASLRNEDIIRRLLNGKFSTGLF